MMPAELRPVEAADWTFEFEGEKLSAVPGETIAATLIAHGRLQQSFARDGSPRGHFCGMGVCHDCLVTVDGEPSVRACMTLVERDMRIRRQAYARPAALPTAERPPPKYVDREPDVLVVGAGPAGLSAAVVLAEGGADILVVDERPGLGGQFYKQPYGRAGTRRSDRQALAGAALIGRAKAADVAFESGATVIGAERTSSASIEVAVLAGRDLMTVKPRFLVIATGAYERPICVPGWTLPGVMTTGAAQTLVRSFGVSPGRRVLLAGNGPLNLQVANELVGLADEICLIEAAPPPWRRALAGIKLGAAAPDLAWQGIASLARLHARGAMIRWRHRLVEVRGGDRAREAVIAPLDPDGQCLCEKALTLAVDAVITGDGFWPSSELARLLGCKGTLERLERDEDGSTSARDIFIAGEAGGFGGARIALAQGELAGLEILRRLDRRANGNRMSARSSLRRARRFQAALWDIYATKDAGLDLATPTTVICRCEAIDRGTLETAIARHDVHDAATLKRLTRAGMGRCQGRYCVPHLACLLGGADEQGLAPQMPLRPVPIGPMADEAPEWHGHSRLLPETAVSQIEGGLPVDEADTIIIGAGVVGLATAYFLAREGHSVVVLERGFPNSGASGGNAGSLHAQLLSFDHGDKTNSAAGAARTLPLQAESISLWRQLQHDFDMDLEISITGGLMVAETDADIAFLKAKTAVEREHGIDSRVIGRDELRALEPNVSRHFMGAAYCSQEGKINPLVATEGLRRGAMRAGALVVPRTMVTGLERAEAGFVVTTSRGVLKSGRIVNASGAFAGRVGELLDARVPVFGAPLQMIVTEAVEPLVSCLLAYAGRHLTLKQAANGNVIIGGAWTAGLDPINNHPRPLLSSIKGNLWVAKRAVPALSTVRVIRSWAAMNIDIDGAPIIGEHPSVPGFYNAVTANGYTLGPLVGQLTAELILTGRTAHDLSMFSLSRFR